MSPGRAVGAEKHMATTTKDKEITMEQLLAEAPVAANDDW
jgi:hypothetical protein